MNLPPLINKRNTKTAANITLQDHISLTDKILDVGRVTTVIKGKKIILITSLDDDFDIKGIFSPDHRFHIYETYPNKG